MRRPLRLALIAIPLMLITASLVTADVKTRDRSTLKFEGMLGRVFNFFGGKAAKDGLQSMTAVKGSRKASINDATGQIIDLSEEKVYDLDMRKKTYTVKTFDQIRKEMEEQRAKAEKQAEQAQKDEPGGGQPQEAQKPQKEYQVDFDVKDAHQTKQIAGYETHETIVTVTVHEKGVALEDGGGMVMTTDTWLGPKIPQLKEITDFDMKYWQALHGTNFPELSADQMATVLAMYPLVAKASESMQKNSDKLSGTPLDTTVTFDAVKSKEQMAQQAQSQPSSGGGGIGGLLAKKMMKKNDAQQRATIFTTHHEVLEVGTAAAAADVAIPADFKEKK
jgi:hypothetical protein